MYISLHKHYDRGSIGDSALKIPDCIKRAKEYNLPAVAVTDHGSLAAIYSFSKECKKHGIKPIIGCEVYVAHDRLLKDKGNSKYYHLILIAKNDEGYKNLVDIVNDSHLNGFYSKPRTDHSVLQKYGKGIIALSACLAGEIPRAILENDTSAVDTIEFYKEIFDDFYLELQPGNFQEQVTVNNVLVQLAEYTDTKLIATNDVHYLDKDDYKIHDLHVRIHRKMLVDDDNLVYPDKCYWFMDKENLIKAFAEQSTKSVSLITKSILEEAINNTVLVAEQCDLVLSEEIHMPAFKTAVGNTEEYELTELCFRRLNAFVHGVEDPQQYVERMAYELGVIKQLGFCGYFLMVHDLIAEAKRRGIPVGPGRGSVGGSLVSYILGITLADPIKYDLLFERFLSPHRKSMPDCCLEHFFITKFIKICVH